MEKSHKTDEQLYAILRETGRWAVYGNGRPLGFAPSLQTAIHRADAFASSGAIVTGLARLPSNNIVVPLDQVERLRKAIIVREMVAA
jgi:hypothetical protein